MGSNFNDTGVNTLRNEKLFYLQRPTQAKLIILLPCTDSVGMAYYSHRRGFMGYHGWQYLRKELPGFFSNNGGACMEI
jgi:hypothetical protein